MSYHSQDVAPSGVFPSTERKVHLGMMGPRILGTQNKNSMAPRGAILSLFRVGSSIGPPLFRDEKSEWQMKKTQVWGVATFDFCQKVKKITFQI